MYSVHVVHPYSSMDTATGEKKSRLILSERPGLHMIDNLSGAFYAFTFSRWDIAAEVRELVYKLIVIRKVNKQEADDTPHKQLRTLTTLMTKSESLQHNLEKAADDICLHVSAGKTEYICFNQNKKGDMSTRKGSSLKLVDKFPYLENSV